MELHKLIRAVRIKAIAECQDMIVKHYEDDRHVLAARLSDLKLFKPDKETVNMIKEHETWNSKKKTSNTPLEI